MLEIHKNLKSLQDVWDSRKHPGRETSFFDWFVANKCEEMVFITCFDVSVKQPSLVVH